MGAGAGWAGVSGKGGWGREGWGQTGSPQFANRRRSPRFCPLLPPNYKDPSHTEYDPAPPALIWTGVQVEPVAGGERRKSGRMSLEGKG